MRNYEYLQKLVPLLLLLLFLALALADGRSLIPDLLRSIYINGRRE